MEPLQGTPASSIPCGGEVQTEAVFWGPTLLGALRALDILAAVRDIRRWHELGSDRHNFGHEVQVLDGRSISEGHVPCALKTAAVESTPSPSCLAA